MQEAQKQENYALAEKLMSEQNFAAAVVAGAVATVISATAFGIIVARWTFSYGFAAAGVGIAIGLPMGFLGRGISTKFAVLAALYVIAGSVLGNLFRLVMQLAVTSPIDVLRNHSLSELFEQAIANIFTVNLVYWFVAVVCAAFFARRALSRSERLAIGMLELKVQQHR